MALLKLKFNSQPFEIPHYLGGDGWKNLLKLLSDKFPAYTLFAITDSNVGRIYKEVLTTQLSSFPGFKGILTFPAGEPSKSREQKAALEDQLLQQKAGRDTLILGVGGGVTGDLTGYVAATLHRGVPLIHLPTSLLAMVDSSIGGKVGVNHPSGKNLIGAFHQPKAVFIQPQFLTTLPEIEFRNGLAEVIKYAPILDEELWSWLEEAQQEIQARNPEILKKIIHRCVFLKIKVVERDEKETDFRSILNFGHTLGHAIERLGNYRIKHGFAVAEGMVVAARLSNQIFGYSNAHLTRLIRLLKSFNLLETDISHFSLEDLWSVMLTDKKARQQSPRFTLLNKSGKAELFYPVTKEELKRAFKSE